MVCAIVLIFQNSDRYNHFEINLWYIVLLRKKQNTPYP